MADVYMPTTSEQACPQLSGPWSFPLQAYLARAHQVCALNVTQVQEQYRGNDAWVLCGD